MIESTPDTDTSPDDDLAYWAWTIIANVGHNLGGWEVQDPEWVEAAEKWRDAFHTSLEKQRTSNGK